MSDYSGSNSLPVVEKVITKEQIRRYADASGDLNPVHLDEDFASTSYFGKVVAHGMLTLAFLSEMLTLSFGPNWLANGALKVRFKKPAYPGERLRTWGRISKEEQTLDGRLIHCSIALLTCPTDTEVVVGSATVHLDNDHEIIGQPL